jgi:hypothetical protein
MRCRWSDLGVGTLNPRSASPSVFLGAFGSVESSPNLHRGLRYLWPSAQKIRSTQTGTPYFWCRWSETISMCYFYVPHSSLIPLCSTKARLSELHLYGELVRAKSEHVYFIDGMVVLLLKL